jgi:hypothetical protein
MKEVKFKYITIEYNCDINSHPSVCHTADFKNCIHTGRKKFSVEHWEKALNFYLECTAPITSLQEIKKIIPKPGHKLLNSILKANECISWVLKARKNAFILN